MSSNNSSDTFQVGPAITSGSNSNVNLAPFTWNPSSGYVVGHMHNHPQGNAPNPSDIMNGVNLSQMSTTPGSGYGEVELKMYGNAINLSKQNVYSTNSNVQLNIDSSNKVTTNDPC